MVMIKNSDLKLLAEDCFESLAIDFATDKDCAKKVKHYVAIYLKTGDNVGLNIETKRLVDALMNYGIYQMQKKLERVSIQSPLNTIGPPNR